MPWIKPDGVENKLDNKRDGQSIDKVQPLECGFFGYKGGDDEGENSNYPDNAFGNVGNDSAVILVFTGDSLGNGLGGDVSDEGIKCDPVKICKLNKYGNIGRGLAPFPF